MSIAIMQPYFFPYIGYFQLINASDTFIFYDDVNFITRGWINRNKIMINGSSSLISVPLNNASQNKLINEVKLSNNEKPIKKLLKSIKFSYSKAPYFSDVYPIIEHTLLSNSETIADLSILSVKEVSEYLGLTTEFKLSSNAYNNKELKKADRLIDICIKEGDTDYINPIGGAEIYTKEYFSDRGINLYFLDSQLEEYDQNNGEFIPGLSIIDVLMFNSKQEIRDKHLKTFKLI